MADKQDERAGTTKESNEIKESPPVQSPPVQSPPVQSPPVQSPPVQSPPVQSPPVQLPPVQPSPSQSLPLSREQIIKTAIDQIDETAERGRKELRWFSVDGWKSYLSEIDNAARECVDDLLATTLKDACTTAKDTLLTTVKERREKLPLSTGITDQIIGICQSLLAFGAGGLALSLAFIDKASKLSVPVQKYLAIAGIFYVELVIVSVLSLILYMLQARFRYPFLYFKKIGNARPWFYYASISPEVPRGAIQLSRSRLKANSLYAKDFINFAEKLLDEDYNKKLRNEIQQYFLLMSYQGYVHQFSIRLANFFMYGFVGAFTSALIMFVLVWIFGF